ncbi:YchJ family protein [Catenovulum sp. 2E275]|uniref:YchJ family protein n=1 Tax=Catenovulum sp. 2E275 TaxID=2980497 RepID=UPI0021D2E9C1|nr:YchJ family protein [Catenovulum sp. 2E275]MCU4674639.1 YchJ family protein [Catenovulum sp. 2E275]
MLCPCQSQLTFETCCAPLIQQQKHAETAEQLMRSRYSAYATQAVDYIYQTQLPDSRSDNLKAEIAEFANSVKFVGLTVLNSQQMTESQAQVEFIAKYIDTDKLVCMQEVSNFLKQDNSWFYVDGKLKVEQHKINRNQLCVCGSGKKFKRCCG